MSVLSIKNHKVCRQGATTRTTTTRLEASTRANTLQITWVVGRVSNEKRERNTYVYRSVSYIDKWHDQFTLRTSGSISSRFCLNSSMVWCCSTLRISAIFDRCLCVCLSGSWLLSIINRTVYTLFGGWEWLLSLFAAEQNKQKQNETKKYCLNLVNRFGGTTRTRHTLHSLAHSHNTDTIERRRKHDQSRVAKSPLDASFLQERSRERERERARERCGRMRAKEYASMREQGLWEVWPRGGWKAMLLCVRRDFFVDAGAAGRSELLLGAWSSAHYLCLFFYHSQPLNALPLALPHAMGSLLLPLSLSLRQSKYW